MIAERKAEAERKELADEGKSIVAASVSVDAVVKRAKAESNPHLAEMERIDVGVKRAKAELNAHLAEAGLKRRAKAAGAVRVKSTGAHAQRCMLCNPNRVWPPTPKEIDCE